MAKLVSQSKQFKKDIKKRALSENELDTLKRAVRIIVAGERLPQEMRDHDLIGNYKGFRECHLGGDLLLIYKRTKDEVRLARVGSHSELFR